MAANSSDVNTNPKGSLIGDLIDEIGLETVVDLAASAVSGSSKKRSGSSRKKDSKSDSLISKLLPEKPEYPQFSEKTYWAVREKFQKSIPEKVTASTLTNATGLKADTIKNTVLPALVVLGLLNKDNKPTNKLKAWINDAKYEDTCKDIAESVYPPSLMKLGFNTKSEKDSAQKWFVKYSGVSESTAKKMLGIYLLFVDPKLKAAADKKAASTTKKSTSASKKSAPDAVVDSLKVTSKSGKATITLKIIADEGISKKALTSLFTDAAADAFKEMN